MDLKIGALLRVKSGPHKDKQGKVKRIVLGSIPAVILVINGTDTVVMAKDLSDSMG